MPELVSITDPSDPRVGDYATLKDTQLRKRYENQAGVFIAEGPNVVLELLASHYPTRSLLLTPARAEEMAVVLDGVSAPVFVAERSVLDAIVHFPLHQGAIACGQRLEVPSPTEVVTGARCVAVLEDMNDHENMGSIFRSARGLGIDGILLGPRSADPLYRRCVRVSMGHVLHVPFAPIGALPESLGLLEDAGLTTVSLTPDPSAPLLADLEVLGPVALLLGAEGPGLATTTMARSHRRARIPMSGGVDSLNVSVAAAIAFHHLGRQDRLRR